MLQEFVFHHHPNHCISGSQSSVYLEQSDQSCINFTLFASLCLTISIEKMIGQGFMKCLGVVWPGVDQRLWLGADIASYYMYYMSEDFFQIFCKTVEI